MRGATTNDGMTMAVDAVFAIKPDDVKRIVASRPGKKAKGGKKRG